MFRSTGSGLSTMERQTQTEPPSVPKWKQVWLCFLGDEKFKKQREREVQAKGKCKMLTPDDITKTFDMIIHLFCFCFVL